MTKIAACIIQLETLESGARQSSLSLQEHYINLEAITKILDLLEQKTWDIGIMEVKSSAMDVAGQVSILRSKREEQFKQL